MLQIPAVRTKKVLLGIILLTFCLTSRLSWAKIDCTALPHWAKLKNGLKINQKHIFCGEWSKNRVKGFHARPEGINPTTVKYFTLQNHPNTAGIYTGRWSHRNQPTKNKFSSMFPDGCSPQQILNSITHASSHPKKCPTGSPQWLSCGNNKPREPSQNKSQYCSINNQFFTIGFASPRHDKINTAFPLYK